LKASPPRSARLGLRAAATLLAAAAAAGPAGARDVRIPLGLDHAFLERLLTAQVFTEPDGTARIETRDRCSQLVLSNPSVGAAEGGVRVRSDARARAGLGVAGACWLVLDWEGAVVVDEEPVLEPGLPAVRFRAVDASVLPREPGWLASGRLWEWIEPAVLPRLEALRVDLGPPLAEVRAVLPLFVSGADADAARRAVDSLAIESVRAGEGGLALVLHLEVPEPPPPAAPPAPEPPLSPEEIAAFELSLLRWDAFLTFVIKQVGRDTLDPALRHALLEVLIDARHALVEALADVPERGADPARALFRRTWTRLAPILREVDAGLPLEGALRYLAFVAAGDALAALDALGPAFGFEISAEGLRRLARALAPEPRSDPLEYETDVDAELRALFGFDVPLPAPRPPPDDAVLVPDGAPAEPAPEGAPPPETAPPAPPPTDAPSQAPAAPPATAPNDESPGTPPSDPPAPPPGDAPAGPEARAPFLERLARLARAALGAAPARASEADPRVRLAERLAGWAPSAADAPRYLPLARELLGLAAADAHAGGALPADTRELFRALVLATAWQESCWRQLVRRGDRAVPLRSSAGAVGIMQVSERVWRGFYDVSGLRWDVAYNARAGSEILAHYLRDFALPRAERGRLARGDALARSTYAMYHGGPSHAERWRNAGTRPALRAIDAAFLAKLRAVQGGDELAVARCYAG
jgi:hypothetical protein